MDPRLMNRLIAPLARAVSNMAARASVVLADSSGRLQRLQVRILNGEAKSSLDHMEAYGLTSCPLPGAEGVTLFFGGDRSHGVAILIGDRRYRLAGLAPGEVALYDDIGHKVHLTRNGIVVDGAGQQILFTNAPKARFEMDIEATGEIKDLCDTDGKTMSGMRAVYNGHTHDDPQGGAVAPPNEGM